MANEFFTILTATGRNKLANATATATPLNLTQMAVGDGDNGAYYSPTEAQTTLKHEVWRGAINHLAVDANNPNWIVAELVIPDDVGGFYIREVGLFDSAGAMIAVGKFPESYKPTLAAGSNKQLYVRMILEVANTSAVTLLVDPSVVLATRQYCDDKVASEINKLDGKQSVLVATTAAIALTGLQTIDGVVLAAGDRVLVKDQAQAKDNGIYVVAAGVWVRAADADAAIEVTPGLFVFVEKGTANADSIWQLVTDAPITLGTTALLWEMVSGKAGITAGTYRQVTVDLRGRVTGGANPTTRAGYGLTDAASNGVNSDITEMNAVVRGSVFRKNAVINGNFDFWQRGSSGNVVSGGAAYGPDRWMIFTPTGVTASWARSAFAVGAGYNEAKFYLGATFTGAISGSNFRQRIEGVETFAGKTVTVSFYAYATVAQVCTVSLRQNFGTGGAPSAEVLKSGSVNIGTGFQKFSVTLGLDSIAGKVKGTNGNDYLELIFSFAAAQNFTAYLASVQVEQCEVATEFDRRHLQQELALCQRYYEKSYDIETPPGTVTAEGSVTSLAPIASTSAYAFSTPFKVTKRVVPSITIYRPSTGTSGAGDQNDGTAKTPAIGKVGSHGFEVNFNNDSGKYGFAFHYAAAAEL